MHTAVILLIRLISGFLLGSNKFSAGIIGSAVSATINANYSKDNHIAVVSRKKSPVISMVAAFKDSPSFCLSFRTLKLNFTREISLIKKDLLISKGGDKTILLDKR